MKLDELLHCLSKQKFFLAHLINFNPILFLGEFMCTFTVVIYLIL